MRFAISGINFTRPIYLSMQQRAPPYLSICSAQHCSSSIFHNLRPAPHRSEFYLFIPTLHCMYVPHPGDSLLVNIFYLYCPMLRYRHECSGCQSSTRASFHQHGLRLPAIIRNLNNSLVRSGAGIEEGANSAWDTQWHSCERNKTKRAGGTHRQHLLKRRFP